MRWGCLKSPFRVLRGGAPTPPSSQPPATVPTTPTNPRLSKVLLCYLTLVSCSAVRIKFSFPQDVLDCSLCPGLVLKSSRALKRHLNWHKKNITGKVSLKTK
jgi:hypothetical protein